MGITSERPTTKSQPSLAAQVATLQAKAAQYRLSEIAAKRRLKEIAEALRDAESRLPRAGAPLQERLEAKGARKLAAKIRSRIGKWGYQ